MKKRVYEPLGFRVMVEIPAVEEMSKGGIVLTDMTKSRESEHAAEGKLVALGRDAFKDYTEGLNWAEVGDNVGFIRHTGVIKEDGYSGKTYRILNDSDLYYKFTEIEEDDNE